MNSFIDSIKEIWDNNDPKTALLSTILIVIGMLVFLASAFCVKAWIVMLLWNKVMVDLFALPAIGFWMSFALTMLCSYLFNTIKLQK